MKREDIEHLARLSRIELTDAEYTAFAQDFDSILGYVEAVKDIGGGEAEPETGKVSTVLRADEPTHEPGVYSEELLKAAPDRDGRYVKVRKILVTDEE